MVGRFDLLPRSRGCSLHFSGFTWTQRRLWLIKTWTWWKNFWHNFQHSVRTLGGFLTNRHNCTSNSPFKGKTLEIFFIRSGTDFTRWQIIQRLNWQLREVSSTQDKKCFDKSFFQCYGKILSLTPKVASMDYDKFARLIVEQFSLISSILAPSLCSVCQ